MGHSSRGMMKMDFPSRTRKRGKDTVDGNTEVHFIPLCFQMNFGEEDRDQRSSGVWTGPTAQVETKIMPNEFKSFEL